MTLRLTLQFFTPWSWQTRIHRRNSKYCRAVFRDCAGRWTGDCYFLNIYLDSSCDPNIKVQQLNTFQQLARANIREGDIIFLGGVRNHIRSDERVNKTGAKSQPIPAVVDAWDGCMEALNYCTIIPQTHNNATIRILAYSHNNAFTCR